MVWGNIQYGLQKYDISVGETVHATIDDAVEAKMAAHCQNTKFIKRMRSVVSLNKQQTPAFNVSLE